MILKKKKNGYFDHHNILDNNRINYLYRYRSTYSSHGIKKQKYINTFSIELKSTFT